MFRRSISLIVCSSLLGALVLVPATRAQQIQMPRINYKERTLPNGLRVLSAVDTSSPTVAIQVWYHVGSKDDPEGRSGFAHLFEHLMFKSTKHMKSEMLDRLTEDVGGFNNAFTADDVTVYHEVVPSNYLETLLWAEADRLATLNVDDANFKSEREVVKEEFRTSVLAPPYGRFNYLIEQKSFTKHPYRRPGIGSIENLDAATLADVRAFHTTFYRPDNATLIVVGDFEQKQLDTWVDKYFTGIPKPSAPLPRVQVQEPARAQEARFTEYGQNVPLPAVAFSYLIPRKVDADNAALRIADALLSAGESSRLYQSLVYQQQLAQSINTYADLREDVSLFVLYAILASGKKPDEAGRALAAEIKKLQDAPVAAAELEKAKNQLITNQLRERETNNGKAQALGDAAVLLGDPNRANTDIAGLQAVTPADVQRVMKKYFSDMNRVVLNYLPESMRADNREAEKRGAQPLSTINIVATNNPAVSSGPRPAEALASHKLSEPQSSYPIEAKKKKASGKVVVEVIVDEKGYVVKAKAISGHPLLREAAEKAARQARFSPTLVSGVPVKVQGVITYNFVPE